MRGLCDRKETPLDCVYTWKACRGSALIRMLFTIVEDLFWEGNSLLNSDTRRVTLLCSFYFPLYLFRYPIQHGPSW